MSNDMCIDHFPPIRPMYINNAMLITIIIFLVLRKQHTQVVLQLLHSTHTLQSICIHKLEEEYYYVLLHTADLTICLSDHVLGRRSGRPITQYTDTVLDTDHFLYSVLYHVNHQMVPPEHFSPAAASVPFPPLYNTTPALSQQSIYLLLDRCITTVVLSVEHHRYKNSPTPHPISQKYLL